jgi:HD superfamily phosphodiesterase
MKEDTPTRSDETFGWCRVIEGMQHSTLPSDYWSSTDPKPEFPELEASHAITGRNGQSVFDHTMLVIDILSKNKPAVNIITLLSGLFHDLGKVSAQHIEGAGSKFPNHNIESAKIVEVRLEAWGASSFVIDRVARLVSTHMYDITNATRDKTVRKFVVDIGLDNVENWFALRIADSRSYSAHRKHYTSIIEPFRKVVMSYLARQPSGDQPTFLPFETKGVLGIKGGDI